MDREDKSCGLAGWRPSFLQRFATNKTFIVVFGLLGTLQATSFVYFVATLTTLEKRFQMPSQTMGILMSGNEISQILLVLILSHWGGKGNRPRWIASGVAISALSCFILALPHFIYGPGDAALRLTQEHWNGDIVTTNVTTTGSPFTCDPNRPQPECSKGDYKKSIVPMVLVFISQFVLGIGTSLYFSLGQTYMDDNTKKTNTPMLLGVTMALRTLGPAGGFLLGSLCLSLYIDPSLTPVIPRRDPRWLGAWWLGWVLLGSAMFLFALLIGLFPKNLPKKRTKLPKNLNSMRSNPIYVDPCTQIDEPENSLISEYIKCPQDSPVEIPQKRKEDKFWPSLLRILTNPLLTINNMVAVFYILGASGYFSFYNKYTETQFNSSASHSNMVAAISTIFSLVVGFLLSGYVISKWKPRTSYLLIWNILVGIIYVSGEILIMFLACPDGKFKGNLTENGALDPSAECNLGCACDNVKYSPVCDTSTQTTFFSACHAGCLSMSLKDMGKRLFSNCSCVGDMSLELTQGPCPLDCGQSFYLFMFAVVFMQMIGCTGRITNVLINYRSVKQQDKALAQGSALMLISLFAFIPGPIIFGKIIDNACLIWDNTCGEKGNCWLYDKTNFRIYLNATAAALSSVAVILDFILYFLGKDLKLYGDDVQTEFEHTGVADAETKGLVKQNRR